MTDGAERIRVLCVHDDPAFTAAVAEDLDRSDDRIEVVTEATTEGVLRRVDEESVDCIVNGHHPPETDGLAFLDAVDVADQDVPFILVTDPGTGSVATEALSAGATDSVRRSDGTDWIALLANRVTNAVARNRAERALEAGTDRDEALPAYTPEGEVAERGPHPFRQLLDHSSDEIYVMDPATGRILDANETACDRLGYSLDELTALRVVDIAAGIEAHEWPGHAETVRKAGGVVFLANHVRSDGSSYPVEVNVVNVEVAEGEYMISINRDMSERREQERELLRYRAIIESIDDAVFMLAPDGTYAYVNEAAAANTRFGREELVGMHFVEVLQSGLLEDDDDRAAFVELVEELLAGERTDGRMVLRVETTAGDRRVLDTELVEVTSSQQGRLGAAGMTRDITDRIEHQEELERQNERLDAFASVLGHDLRNPLNVAEGRVRMARDKCDSTDLVAASEAHERMRTLIDDLLTMAKTGRPIGRTEAIHLEAAASHCWGMVETGCAELDVVTDRVLHAHRSRLDQLLENLFRNAVEHGGEAATVTVGELDDGFFVADDGPGIPAAERDRVLELGYSTSDDGTGLGLAIIDQIASAHGWDVRVTERPGGGTSVEFTGVSTGDS